MCTLATMREIIDQLGSDCSFRCLPARYHQLRVNARACCHARAWFTSYPYRMGCTSTAPSTRLPGAGAGVPGGRGLFAFSGTSEVTSQVADVRGDGRAAGIACHATHLAMA